jgi:hypothetical protein
MFEEESQSVLDYTCETSNPWHLIGWLIGLVGHGFREWRLESASPRQLIIFCRSLTIVDSLHTVHCLGYKDDRHNISESMYVLFSSYTQWKGIIKHDTDNK